MDRGTSQSCLNYFRRQLSAQFADRPIWARRRWEATPRMERSLTLFFCFLFLYLLSSLHRSHQLGCSLAGNQSETLLNKALDSFQFILYTLSIFLRTPVVLPLLLVNLYDFERVDWRSCCLCGKVIFSRYLWFEWNRDFGRWLSHTDFLNLFNATAFKFKVRWP